MTDPKEMTDELTTYDDDEWWDIAREINPTITREQFDEQMAEFVAEKRRRMQQ